MTRTACPICEGTGEVQVVVGVDPRRARCRMCDGTGLLSPDDDSSPAGTHVERRT